MILLDWSATVAGSDASGVAAVFGSGLVGSALVNSLTKMVRDASSQRLHWDWSKHCKDQYHHVESAVRDALEVRQGRQLSFVWAAGRSSFSTDNAGMADEMESLKNVLSLARRIGAVTPETRRSFHLVSSAGGLFEGQLAIDPCTAPRPLRPYGEGKLQQERVVLADEQIGLRRIFRLSSAFGYAVNGRRGLVPALIGSALNGSPAKIIGSLGTQRDYVFAPDIGRYIARSVLSPGSRSVDTHLLASGRSATLFEVIRLVEDLFGVPLNLQIDPRPQNARDTTFLVSVVPPTFLPTPLREGIALTALSMAQSRTTGMLV